MQDYLNEEWKDVIGFEGLYKVSNFGRVKSLSRIIMMTNRIYNKKESLLKLHIEKICNYKRQYTILTKNSKHYHKRIHRIVLELC